MTSREYAPEILRRRARDAQISSCFFPVRCRQLAILLLLQIAEWACYWAIYK